MRFSSRPVVLVASMALVGVVAAPAAEPLPTPTPLAGLPVPPLRMMQPPPAEEAAGSSDATSRGVRSPTTYGELGREIDEFLKDEVGRAREQAFWRTVAEERQLGPSLIRPTTDPVDFVHGVPETVRQSSWGDPGPIGAALALGFSWLSDKDLRQLRACRDFQAARGIALRAYWNTHRKPDAESLPPGVIAAVRERQAEIRSYAPCRVLKRP